MHHQLDYATKIRAQGYRLTPQRQIILDTLCAIGGHATALEIYARVLNQMPTINQATIYRVLDFLHTIGLVAKTKIQDKTVYELLGEASHHHLVCRQCGYIAQLADYHFAQLIQHIREAHHFEVSHTHLALSGLCAQCIESKT